MSNEEKREGVPVVSGLSLSGLPMVGDIGAERGLMRG
jgi:hypothetical protein